MAIAFVRGISPHCRCTLYDDESPNNHRRHLQRWKCISVATFACMHEAAVDGVMELVSVYLSSLACLRHDVPLFLTMPSIVCGPHGGICSACTFRSEGYGHCKSDSIGHRIRLQQLCNETCMCSSAVLCISVSILPTILLTCVS